MSALAPIHNWSALLHGAEPASHATIREWRRLLVLSPANFHKAGTRLLGQSSIAHTVYLIESGIVKLSRVSPGGREITLLLRFPGDLVGTYGAVLRLSHFVSATAVTNCQLAEIPAGAVLNALRANVEAAYFLAQRQTIDAARIHSLLMEARLLSTAQRLFRLLLQLAIMTRSTHPGDSYVSVRVALSELEIADLIAMNRSAFSRLKRTLIRSGDLQQEANVFSFSRHLAETDIST